MWAAWETAILALEQETAVVWAAHLEYMEVRLEQIAGFDRR
jgi:hypothetical protein